MIEAMNAEGESVGACGRIGSESAATRWNRYCELSFKIRIVHGFSNEWNATLTMFSHNFLLGFTKYILTTTDGPLPYYNFKSSPRAIHIHMVNAMSVVINSGVIDITIRQIQSICIITASVNVTTIDCKTWTMLMASNTFRLLHQNLSV